MRSAPPTPTVASGVSRRWAEVLARLRGRRAGHAVADAREEGPGPSLAETWPAARSLAPEAARVQLEVALNAFHHIGGVVPPRPTAEDCARLQLLDAVIARVHAFERMVFVAHGRRDPDSQRAHYEEFLRRLNARPAVPPPPPRPDLVGRVAAGEPVTLRLRVHRLSPGGLVALGQLVQREPGVVLLEVRWEDADATSEEPWVGWPGAGA
jgi:hypothetical protein